MVEHYVRTEEQIPITSNDVRVVVMAGGLGTRLRAVTNGLIPKDFVTLDPQTGTRAVDHTHSLLKDLGITDVIYSANHYLNQYKQELGESGYRFHYQIPGDGHGLDFKKIIDEYGDDKQYLILSTDLYFEKDDLQRLIVSHRPGTITRGVTHLQYEELRSYHNMYSDLSNAVVGDSRSSYSWRVKENQVERYTSSPLTLIDPKLYLNTFEIHRRLCKKETDIDLWHDIGFLLAERNRRQIERGNDSIYNISIFSGPMIDFGTPETLELARIVYRSTGGKR